jgi:hypothetical protein
MPFPLAHPAAVLPLRRYCPRWLNLPALIIGSVSPDAGYLFGELQGGHFSHGFLGSAAFCLPLGVVVMALFYRLRMPLVKMLPTPYERALLPLCQRPQASLRVILLSLLIGAWSHVLWDSFTHTNGWMAEHVPLLQIEVALVAGRQARVCHLLWYACSFAGVVWVFATFEKWKRRAIGPSVGIRGNPLIRDAVLVALSVVPIELVHHFVRLNRLGLCLLAVACALLVVGILLRVANVHKHATVPDPAEGPKVD